MLQLILTLAFRCLTYKLVFDSLISLSRSLSYRSNVYLVRYKLNDSYITHVDLKQFHNSKIYLEWKCI